MDAVLVSLAVGLSVIVSLFLYFACAVAGKCDEISERNFNKWFAKK